MTTNEKDLRDTYEQKLQDWKDAEDAYTEGQTSQQKKDMDAAEQAHDTAAKALTSKGYSL